MKYLLLFDGNLGIMKGIYLKFKKNVVLKFFKFRLVLFVLKEKIVGEF